MNFNNRIKIQNPSELRLVAVHSLILGWKPGLLADGLPGLVTSILACLINDQWQSAADDRRHRVIGGTGS